jgi:hypothetical protein
MQTILVAVALTIFPPKPDLTLRFNDISITQAIGSAKLVGIKLDLPFKIEGRVGLLVVELRGKVVMVRAERISVAGDYVRWVRGYYNRRTEQWALKAEALGGLIELEGVIPK